MAGVLRETQKQARITGSCWPSQGQSGSQNQGEQEQITSCSIAQCPSSQSLITLIYLNKSIAQREVLLTTVTTDPLINEGGMKLENHHLVTALLIANLVNLNSEVGHRGSQPTYIISKRKN